MAARARASLEDAGLADLVDVSAGDARETVLAENAIGSDYLDYVRNPANGSLSQSMQ